jgi:ABC-type sugar transport system ATPase subunit
MLGSDLNPTAKMESLSVGERQLVEIARALAMGSEVVIFDEPTSSLSFKEKDVLFKVIRRLRQEGKAIVYITHFLDEVLELCDKFVVLRNGKLHGHGLIKDITKRDIIKMIIGRDLTVERKQAGKIAPNLVLKVENIRSGRLLQDISFELHKGEILGLWGLMGSGRTELMRAVLGLDRIDAGDVYLAEEGKLARIAPHLLLSRCGYITESRHADGLFLGQPVWKNLTATALGKYASRFFRFLNVRKEVRAATEYIGSLRITAPGPQTRVENLSGGNQQKVVFAKWLNRRPGILFLDEPTRGVDVGAKLEINGLVRTLAGEGTAALVITSEVEEMVGLADRVLVLREGRIVAAAEGAEINNATLMRLALGEEQADAA